VSEVSISPQAGIRFLNKNYWGWSEAGASLPGGTGIKDFFKVVSVLVIQHRGVYGTRFRVWVWGFGPCVFSGRARGPRAAVPVGGMGVGAEGRLRLAKPTRGGKSFWRQVLATGPLFPV
jgi:hypothetical protein